MTDSSPWPTMAFSEAVAINPKRRLAKSGEVPFLDMASLPLHGAPVRVSEKRPVSSGGARFQSGDTLFARITPCAENGKLGFVSEVSGGAVGQGSTEFIVLGARDGQTLPEYVRWLAGWSFVRDHAIGLMEGTSGRQRIPAWAFDEIEVPVPPLDEQRRIAEVLRSVDEAIAANALVAAKARAFMANLGRELLPSPEVEPATGSQPLSLLDICRPRQHPIIGKADLTSSGYPVYGANGQIGYSQSYTHAEPVIAITCRGATCGTVNWVPAMSYVTGNAMALDHLDRNQVNERYLFHYVSVWGVARSISGSAQPQITKQSLSCIDIIAPALERQKEIADALDAVEQEAKAAENALEAAKSVKASALSDLLSGHVRVPA